MGPDVSSPIPLAVAASVGATAFLALLSAALLAAKRRAERERDAALLRAAEMEQELLVARSEFDVERSFERRQSALDGVLRPVREALERVQSETRELERERQRSYALVEAELKRVTEASVRLSAETAALKNALRKPHVRGRWGEAQLKNCIELAGMSEHADVRLQDSSRSDEGSLQVPDMTVRMPGGRVVVVDAKTPLDAYLDSLEASDDGARAADLARHGRQLREHVKRLAKRAYPEHVKGAADFTVMFLPNEAFLYAALEAEPDIVEFALARKILVATPPTLIGLLKAIRFGWNEQRLAQNAEAISEAGVRMHKRAAEFVETFEGIGRALDRARDAYQSGLRRLHGHVLPEARHLESLGAMSAKELPSTVFGDSPRESSAQTQ